MKLEIYGCTSGDIKLISGTSSPSASSVFEPRNASQTVAVPATAFAMPLAR